MNKVMVEHSSRTYGVQVEKVKIPIFSKALIDSQYLISPVQSMELYELSFVPLKMNMALTSLSNLLQQPPYHVFFSQSYFNS